MQDESFDESHATADVRYEMDPRVAAGARMTEGGVSPVDPLRSRASHFAPLRIGTDRHIAYVRGHHHILGGIFALQVFEKWGHLFVDALENSEPANPPPEDFGPALKAGAECSQSRRGERDRSYRREWLNAVPRPSYLTRRLGAISPGTHHISEILPRLTSKALLSRETDDATALPATMKVALTIRLARIAGQHYVQFALVVAVRLAAAPRNTYLPVFGVFLIHAQLDGETTVDETFWATQLLTICAPLLRRYRYQDIRPDLAAASTPVPATPGVAGPVLNLMFIKPTVRFGEATGTVQIVSTGPIDDISLTIYPRAAADGTLGTQIDVDANPNRYTEAEARGAHRTRLRRIFVESIRFWSHRRDRVGRLASLRSRPFIGQVA